MSTIELTYAFDGFTYDYDVDVTYDDIETLFESFGGSLPSELLYLIDFDRLEEDEYDWFKSILRDKYKDKAYESYQEMLAENLEWLKEDKDVTTYKNHYIVLPTTYDKKYAIYNNKGNQLTDYHGVKSIEEAKAFIDNLTKKDK